MMRLKDMKRRLVDKSEKDLPNSKKKKNDKKFRPPSAPNNNLKTGWYECISQLDSL